MNAVLKTVRWPTCDRDRRRLALWTAGEIAEATGGKPSGEFQVAGVEMDSRDVRSGDLFFALKGENSDGHLYLDKAFANGAAAAVVDRPIDRPHVLVADTSRALELLGQAARNRVPARIVGVTGSVGKTGVKEAIFASLDRSGRGAAHRSVRSYNNHVGVPLSLSRMPSRAAFGVFEMGMNHAGEILHLTRQVRPHVAVITTIAPAHIENLGSEEAIADAKAEIFAGLEPGGTAVIPADVPHFGRLRRAAEAAGAEVVAFGTSPQAHVRLLDAIPSANGGSLVTAAFGDLRLCYSVAEPGAHWVANSLAVMAAVHAAGGDLGAAGLALAEMGGLKGRGARHRLKVPGGHALLIDESYNANPASMRAAIELLGQAPVGPRGRRIAVLGDMLELGTQGRELHRGLAAAIEAAGIDLVYCSGPLMHALWEALPSARKGGYAETAEALQPSVLEAIRVGDAVMVKGSLGSRMGPIVKALQRRFPTQGALAAMKG